MGERLSRNPARILIDQSDRPLELALAIKNLGLMYEDLRIGKYAKAVGPIEPDPLKVLATAKELNEKDVTRGRKPTFDTTPLEMSLVLAGMLHKHEVNKLRIEINRGIKKLKLMRPSKSELAIAAQAPYVRGRLGKTLQ
ncbi:MAG: hypothetical protein AAB573_00675 [Patescibacteria group bacterium]